MKRKQGFEIVQIAGEYLLIPAEGEGACGGRTVVLNEVSAFVLNAMRADTSKEALLEALLREYDVRREVAAADLDSLLDTFRQLGLVEP